MTAPDTPRAIESARLIGGLARMVRDVWLADELAHDALVVALERWPEMGVPANPGAWLMATAKKRAIDHLRRRTLTDRCANKTLAVARVPFELLRGPERVARLASVLEVLSLVFDEGYSATTGTTG